LHGLIACHGTKRIHEGLVFHQFPQPIGTALGESVRNRKGPAQPENLLRRMGSTYAIKTAFRGMRDKIVKSGFGHVYLPLQYTVSFTLFYKIGYPITKVQIW
jgi:hypothetical protein